LNETLRTTPKTTALEAYQKIATLEQENVKLKQELRGIDRASVDKLKEDNVKLNEIVRTEKENSEELKKKLSGQQQQTENQRNEMEHLKAHIEVLRKNNAAISMALKQQTSNPQISLPSPPTLQPLQQPQTPQQPLQPLQQPPQQPQQPTQQQPQQPTQQQPQLPTQQPPQQPTQQPPQQPPQQPLQQQPQTPQQPQQPQPSTQSSPLQQLLSMGFPKDQAEDALRAASGQLNVAVDWLLSRM